MESSIYAWHWLLAMHSIRSGGEEAGTHEIKIYTVVNRGRQVFQLSFYEAGKRQRKTCGDMPQARRESEVILGRLALTSQNVDELSIAELESYALARKLTERWMPSPNSSTALCDKWRRS